MDAAARRRNMSAMGQEAAVSKHRDQEFDGKATRECLNLPGPFPQHVFEKRRALCGGIILEATFERAPIDSNRGQQHCSRFANACVRVERV